MSIGSISELPISNIPIYFRTFLPNIAYMIGYANKPTLKPGTTIAKAHFIVFGSFLKINTPKNDITSP